jgi:hypothetical protein
MEIAVMKRLSVLNLGIAVSLIVAAVMLRVLPHPANFAPVAAVAIFGGAVLPRRLAVWVPLAAMMVSDMAIGWHHLVPVTWGCYALIALASSYVMKKPSLLRGLSLTMASSIFFFAATNLAVWQWDKMYDHTLSGLWQCFTMALPFFRNTALSDLVYTSVLFTLYMLATRVSGHMLKLHALKGLANN